MTLFGLLDDKEAEGILVLNMSETNLLTDYFIICTANSTVHMKALIDTVRDFADENGLKVIYADKQAKGDWEILSYMFSAKRVENFMPWKSYGANLTESVWGEAIRLRGHFRWIS